MLVRLNKNTAEVVRLKALANRIGSEAENISPHNDDGSGGGTHPAPVMREWARTLVDIASILEAR